jgi:hypothetical protein
MGTLYGVDNHGLPTWKDNLLLCLGRVTESWISEAARPISIHGFNTGLIIWAAPIIKKASGCPDKQSLSDNETILVRWLGLTRKNKVCIWYLW